MKNKQIKIKYYLLTILVITLTFSACNKNEDDDVTPIDLRDRAEQQVEDKDSLLEYLNSHYYNSSDFDGNLNPSIGDIIITELADGATVPADHTLLINAVDTKTTIFNDENNDVIYEYYILEINKGGGESPNFSDDVRVSYSGNLLDEEVFDSSVIPVDFNLLSLVVGWSRVLPEFNAAESFIENGDGTVSFINPGVGIMFIPSGLAYFEAGPVGVPLYSSLIFKFELYQTKVSDHDSDGIPSFLEDLNGDEDYNNDDDDTDGNGLQDFLDPDDDGDGVLTINELEPKVYIVDTNLGEQEPVLGAKEFEFSRSEDAGIITINTVTIKDSDNNGVDDYLDVNITINYNDEG